MTTYREDFGRRDLGSSTVLAVRIVDNAAEAEALLPVSVLNRLCPDKVQGPTRRSVVYLSQLVVVLDGDLVVGVSAFLSASGAIRWAHGFWVDPHARAGLAPVTEAMQTALEAAAVQAGCSQLFVATVQGPPLRRLLLNAGYRASRLSAEVIWFNKTLVGDGARLKCA